MSRGEDIDKCRFGDFTFDPADNTLRRDGSILSLPPKPLELLRVFLASGGRLLPKADLMTELWPKTFVEEGNLAVTIRQLRKILADDAHNAIYIETVPRQGYRFVAEVVPVEKVSAVQPPPADRNGRRLFVPFAIAASLLIASILLVSLYFDTYGSQAAPILSAPFAVKKLSTSGKVDSSVLSPDGEHVVYTVRSGAGEAVWLREVTGENNVEIIPTSDQDYYNFAFAPDGDTLYFTRGPRTVDDPADLFSVSIFGGIPKKLVSDTRGWISVSPDGKLISFVRCGGVQKEGCSLWIANSSDGSGERMIASRKSPIRIGDHEISPDGKSIVFAVGQTRNAGADFGLVSVELDSGIEKEVSGERFFHVTSLEILPDNSGVLFTASRVATRQYRVWKLNYEDGSVQVLSKDANSYNRLSLDDSGTRLIATQLSHDFRLVRASLGNLEEKQTVADQVGAFDFDANGDFVFQSDSTGDLEIWRMRPDGVEMRQLTNVPGDDIAPVISTDGSTVYFCSNRSGDMQVWRMDGDGSNQRQLTKSAGGIPVFADSNWAYFQHGVERNLWRASTDGKIQETVLEAKPTRGTFVFSTSGKRAAFFGLRNERPNVIVISIPDGRELNSYPLAEGKGRYELAWLPDETAVAYSLSHSEGKSNSLWIQPLDGGEPRRSTNLGDEDVAFISFDRATDSIAFSHGRWKHDLVILGGFR